MPSWAAEHKAAGPHQALSLPLPPGVRGRGGCTSWTRNASCMTLGLRLRSRSMVSYWPWQPRTFSGEPSACFSSTKPTRKMILTPAGGQAVNAGGGGCSGEFLCKQRPPP